MQAQKQALAEQLKLKHRQVEVWFQNRRARYGTVWCIYDWFDFNYPFFMSFNFCSFQFFCFILLLPLITIRVFLPWKLVPFLSFFGWLDHTVVHKLCIKLTFFFSRTKLKQTEVDCEFMRKCYEKLTDENLRLKKELQELCAEKIGPTPLYIQLSKATTLTICSSCGELLKPNEGNKATISNVVRNNCHKLQGTIGLKGI